MTSLSRLMPILLSWAVSSSILILVVLTVRYLVRDRLSCLSRYALWAVVLVRLLVPFQLPFLSAPAAVGSVTELTTELNSELKHQMIYAIPDAVFPGSTDVQSPVIHRTTIDLPNGEKACSGGVVTDRNAVTHYAFMAPLDEILPALWGVGTVGMVLILLGCNLHFGAILRKNRQKFTIQNEIFAAYITNRIDSPCLFGLFRPTIYLTPETTEHETALRHVLAHEQTHYAHGDHIWSVLRCAALALHWYNPLVWLAAVLSKRDGELACDEGAVKRLGESERIAYGRTLVDIVAARSLRPGDLLSCSTSMTGGKNSVRQRVTQLVKKPETKAAAIFGACAALALAAVFTFAGTKEEDHYAQFRGQIQSAVSLHYAPPPYSSQFYPFSITDTDLVEQSKTALDPVRDLLTPGELDWADGDVQSSSTLTLTTKDGAFSYFLCTVPRYERTYVLAPARLDAEEYIPVASLDQGVTAALEKLARQQQERNQSLTRVEYPEFKAALTQLFLGDEECVRHNETPEYDMEEWLTNYTSFYEISHAAPWWLEGAGEGWYARAMDAGSWYTISIPDHLVPQVQAICEEQALYPSLDTIYSVLENTDAIYYAAMSAMTSRSKIQDPAVIDQITQLILASLGNTAQVNDPGRVTIGQEFGVLTIPVDEKHNLSLCLQETEGSCLLSCVWTDDMFIGERDSLPVLWTLPAGTTKEIYTIYENWLSGQGQSAGAPDYDWQGELALDALAPGKEVLSPSSVAIPTGGGLTYHITYARPSLTLEFGLRAPDGTEYCQRVVGGSLAGTIPDIPAGTYQLFVRNSGDYDFSAPGYLNGDVDYNATGALVFLSDPVFDRVHPIS